MPTPIFNLPLINGTSPINIVNDMNALATAADSAMGTLATQSDISRVETKANIATESAANATKAATAAQGAADAATAAASTATATATNAVSTAGSAQSAANSAKATADDAANAIQTNKPKLLWNGSVKTGQAITVPNIQDWIMVGVMTSASSGDGTDQGIMIPCCINSDLSSAQLKGGTIWANASDEIRMTAVTANVGTNTVTFTGSNYDTIHTTVQFWQTNRNINGIYGLIHR